MKTAKYSKQKQNISSYLSPSYKEKKKAVKECAAVLTNSKVLLQQILHIPRTFYEKKIETIICLIL